MEDSEGMLGLFYSDENGVVYDSIKLSENLTDERKIQLKMLPFRFLAPIFMTAASNGKEKWTIEFIEASLYLLNVDIKDVDIIQSFFTLNSSIDSEKGITHLFALIGSRYTEDIKPIHNKMIKYIHPSIYQGKMINEGFQGRNFCCNDFIKNELNRGLELIEYTLGSSRKVYWDKKQNFQCIALIERENTENDKKSYLYTLEKNNPLRKNIPSYYIMSILPSYYENLIHETFEIFGKKGIYPNLRIIKLRHKEKRVIYIEEFSMNNNRKKSLGVVLIPDDSKTENFTNLSYFKKKLRLFLDSNKDLEEILGAINPDFSTLKWSLNSDDNLNQIHENLDNIDLFQ